MHGTDECLIAALVEVLAGQLADLLPGAAAGSRQADAPDMTDLTA